MTVLNHVAFLSETKLDDLRTPFNRFFIRWTIPKSSRGTQRDSIKETGGFSYPQILPRQPVPGTIDVSRGIYPTANLLIIKAYSLQDPEAAPSIPEMMRIILRIGPRISGRCRKTIRRIQKGVLGIRSVYLPP